MCCQLQHQAVFLASFWWRGLESGATINLPRKTQQPWLVCAYWHSHKNIRACLKGLFFLLKDIEEFEDIATSTVTQHMTQARPKSYHAKRQSFTSLYWHRWAILTVQALIRPLQCVYMCTEAITVCSKKVVCLCYSLSKRIFQKCEGECLH